MGTLTVSPGEAITVTNEDTVEHTFTGPGFDTGQLKKGQSATVHAPMKAGSYSFVCSDHSFMTGTLIVT